MKLLLAMVRKLEKKALSLNATVSKQRSRELSLAITHIQQARMWLLEAVSKELKQ